MKHIRVVMALLAMTVISMNLVVAQDAACPSGFSCAEFEGATIALNPNQGFVQYVVVEERSTSVINFQGEESSNEVVLVAFERQPNDAYIAKESHTEDQSGLFANAELGDVFVLRELTNAGE